MGKLASVAVVILVALLGCSRPTPAPTAPPDWPGAVLSAEEVPSPDAAGHPDAASVRRITYVSRSGIKDDYTHVTASIYVPAGSAPTGGFPIVVYGRAIGVPTPDCAFPGATGAAVIDAFLKAGYVVAVPDYPGLGKPSDGKTGNHPYLDSSTAGYTMIDAVRATQKLVQGTAAKWLAVGDAQGGQGAWAANELADDYGHPGLRGTVSVAPIADVDGLADAAAAGTLSPPQREMYIAYLAALATQYPGQFTLDDYRRGIVTDNWNLLLSCQASDGATRTAVIARITPADLRPATPQAVDRLRGYLRKTTLPQGPAKAPMLVAYGSADPLTPAAWTTRAVVRACDMGDAITVREKSSPSLTDPVVLAWMADRFQDKPVADDCRSFVADHPLPSATTPTPSRAAAAPVPAAADPGPAVSEQAPVGGGAAEISLIDGWLPVAIQVAAIAVVIAAIGRRSRRWLPVALITGLALIGAVWWFLDSQGWGPTYPWVLWPWVGLTGVAVAAVVLGWRGASWWRRAVAVAAVPLCVVGTATAVNTSLAYLPTVGTAWLRLSGRQPAQWIDQAGLLAMQRDGARPTRGTVVSITTPSDVSGFSHRDELVYVPPVWFTSTPPPRLPVVMVIGPEFSSPRDWLLYARGLDVLDKFALRHHGAAPLVVFPDTTGSFTNDTECVNGPRGNAADHITKEVVPYVVSRFGAMSNPSGWGAAGWSTGGTCAVMLLVRHPELFGAIVDLEGQLGPNAGPKNQTIARLFGGDERAWAAFDPKTVVQAHGPYRDKAAWIAVSGDIPTTHLPGGTALQPGAIDDWDNQSEDHAKTAGQLCSLLAAHGIECSVLGYPGGHDYRSAAVGFAAALPWLAGRLGTPGVPAIPLPGS